jgi:conserved oligomeric Golgi complex subunit 3
LARYQALLTKALHLLERGFQNRLDLVSAEISKQITSTQSESARHALAYGRFEEMMLDSYALIPNIQKVIFRAYDQFGTPRSWQSADIYTNTAKNILAAYLAARDRDLKPVVQKDLEAFKSEAKSSSVESASRNYVKQSFERSYSEALLFKKLFDMEPQYGGDENSSFMIIKSHRSDLVSGVNIVPVATNLQVTLGPTDLETICNIIGWMTSEYLILEYEDEETEFSRHCRELTFRLLSEHLWTFTDAAFEAEIAKSITRAPIAVDALKIATATNGTTSSNAYPPIKRAMDLLVMFDQAMPKERCVSSQSMVRPL